MIAANLLHWYTIDLHRPRLPISRTGGPDISCRRSVVIYMAKEPSRLLRNFLQLVTFVSGGERVRAMASGLLE